MTLRTLRASVAALACARALLAPRARILVVTRDGDEASAVTREVRRLLGEAGVAHSGSGWSVWAHRGQPAGAPSVLAAPVGSPLRGARVDLVLVTVEPDDIDPEWWDRVVLTALAAGGQALRVVPDRQTALDPFGILTDDHYDRLHRDLAKLADQRRRAEAQGGHVVLP